jgi:glycolate oxidase
LFGGVTTPVSTHPAATQALLARLGAAKVKTDEATCFAASFDNMRLSFMPEAVIRPGTEDDIGVTLKFANEHRVPVTVRGRGTGTTGACAPIKGGWVIHLDHWDKIEIDPVSSMATVQPGAITAHINDLAAPHGLFFPPDPSSVKHCSIGGNIATNAGGLRAAKYGVVRDHVYALEGFLPTGEKVRWAAPLRKFVSGLNLRDLWIGSEGTLAAFTRFWLRLLPLPEKVWTFRATYPDMKTTEAAIHALVAHSSYPAAIEMLDPRGVAMVESSQMACGLPEGSFMLLVEIDGPEALVNARVQSVAELLRHAGSNDVMFSDEDALRQKLWKARKASGGLLGQLSPSYVVQDAVIPKRALAEVLQLVYDEADAAGIRAVNVFHAGDGNLHPNFLFDSRVPGELEKMELISKRLMQRVIEVGGTLSGEHGIGDDKSAYMPLVFGPDSMRLQLSVPAAFNPAHQMNPLKVFDNRHFIA